MNNVALNMIKSKTMNKKIIKISLVSSLLAISTMSMGADHRYKGTPNFKTLTFYNILGQKKGFNPTKIGMSVKNGKSTPRFRYAKKSKYADRKLVPVDYANIHIKRQELASMQAVSEACLRLLPKSSHAKFNTVFNKQLKQLFPKINDPKKAMKYLSKDKKYQLLLKKWKTKYSDKENQKLCNQMINK